MKHLRQSSPLEYLPVEFNAESDWFSHRTGMANNMVSGPFPATVQQALAKILSKTCQNHETWSTKTRFEF